MSRWLSVEVAESAGLVSQPGGRPVSLVLCSLPCSPRLVQLPEPFLSFRFSWQDCGKKVSAFGQARMAR